MNRLILSRGNLRAFSRPGAFHWSYRRLASNKDNGQQSLNNNSSSSSDLPEKQTQQKSGYIPRLTYERVSYEYPPTPKQPAYKPVESHAWKRHIPALVAVFGLAWALYAYKYFTSGDKTSNEKPLEVDKWATYKVTYKENISPSMMIIELSPKYEQHRKIIRQKGGLWNGKKLWSVEVKQPEIQVVRKYTPLPMHVMQYKEGQNGLLRLLGDGEDEGRMVLLVKRYEDGEVSRWLHRLPLGSEIDLRGPFIEFKFPYSPIDKLPNRIPMEDLPSRMPAEYDLPEDLPKPDDIAFFGGGTGIAPILQALWSKNPPRGAVDVHLSVSDRSEIPFSRFLLFLEKAGRAKFHFYVDNENHFLTPDDIPSPVARNYYGEKKIKNVSTELEKELRLKETIEQIKRERSGETTEITAGTNESGESVTSIEQSSTFPSLPLDAQNHSLPTAKNLQSNSDKSIGPRRKYRSVLEQVEENPLDIQPAMAIVCGPDGYVKYVAGPKAIKGQGQVRGLLKAKSWDESNVFKMN